MLAEVRTALLSTDAGSRSAAGGVLDGSGVTCPKAGG